MKFRDPATGTTPIMVDSECGYAVLVSDCRNIKGKRYAHLDEQTKVPLDGSPRLHVESNFTVARVAMCVMCVSPHDGFHSILLHSEQFNFRGITAARFPVLRTSAAMNGLQY